ncbi:conserved hypothetical protein [Ricinus communis]|uniref:DUF4283 domain-containing protein n=1 Tax=Ricinus communis TaxID=3988 RepID=B9SYH1_RICCO|nr:conserved hypothetical protein [Ricinus communis]
MDPEQGVEQHNFDVDVKEGDIKVQMDSLGPTIVLSDDFRNRIKQPWENSVVPKGGLGAVVSSVVAWVQLPGMPMQYYHEKILVHWKRSGKGS